MILYPKTKRELAAAFRAAGDTFDAVTIHYGTARYTFPEMDDPIGPANVPARTWRGTPGWPMRDIITEQDYRRYRCEHYARKAMRL